MQPYERFRAWQACDELVIRVYRITNSFPSHERFGLTSQARRAAISAATNIAEGSAKRGVGEFRRYLDIAVGSLAEVSYLLHVARRLEYLSEAEWHDLDIIRSGASRLTWRLYAAVNKRKNAPTA